MRHVGRDREGAGVAVADQRGVDEGAVGLAVDVGEQAPVAVALLGVADQAYRPATSARFAAAARLAKHCTGVSGLTDSGVSMPM